jgi:hypothetical protein
METGAAWRERIEKPRRCMRDLIDPYRKRVQDLAEHVRGNEQATKQSLIGPLLTLLGYDLTDPRE